MSALTFAEVPHGSAAYEATVTLRSDVLRTPLGLAFTPEELAREHADHHLVGHDDGALVACLVVTPLATGEAKVRQVAVAPDRQGQGVGAALSRFAEDFARQRGFRAITLHARATAVGFYERLGYQRTGEPFEEVTIPHWRMTKTL
ncbi:MAG: GNAT family N-acetyltransferase [Myxococcales bacterium]|nr:MAG: GNAT family N-acetyltransferase [Myxococcales bacterium]